jgi:hypothetical protein
MHRAISSAVLIATAAMSAGAQEAQPAPAPIAAAPVQFFAAIDDLPIPPGLQELGEGFSFETPQGRLVDVIAQGSVSPELILAFYASALPALGWGALEGNSPATPATAPLTGYTRGRESLTLEIVTGPLGSKLRIRLVARPASTALD